MNGRNLQQLRNEGHYEIISTYEGLSERARYYQKLLPQFARRWKSEYLLSLSEGSTPRKGSKEPIIKVGDVVILRNEQLKISFWKLAKTLQLYSGQDGSVCSGKVQVAGDGRRTLNRSFKHLIPLEIHSQCAETVSACAAACTASAAACTASVAACTASVAACTASAAACTASAAAGTASAAAG